MKKIIIQFNEANFDLITRYADNYNLKSLKKIITLASKGNTSSEDEYQNLEPWIQWYSFYSNKKFSDHKVFHLNGYKDKNQKIFLDELIEKDKKIGVFGSMNLPPNNKFNIYIPDPWSTVNADGSLSSKTVNYALKYLVNNNTKFKINLKSLFGLIFLFGFPSLKKISIFFKILLYFIKKDRSKLVAYFDYLFLAYSLRRIKKKKLDFSLIFLNGFAHIQHHYLLNSEFITKKKENPEWYISKYKDPIYDSLLVYNKMFETYFEKYSNYETWIITGLSQEPENSPKIYWRFNNHKKIFDNFFKFDYEIFPHMTRDFEIKVNDKKNLEFVINFLNHSSIRVLKNNQIHKAFGFINNNSSNSVFSSFVYNDEFSELELIFRNTNVNLNQRDLNFVAIKNSIHNQQGWVYTNVNKKDLSNIKIWDLSRLIV